MLESIIILCLFVFPFLFGPEYYNTLPLSQNMLAVIFVSVISLFLM